MGYLIGLFMLAWTVAAFIAVGHWRLALRCQTCYDLLTLPALAALLMLGLFDRMGR